MAGKDQREAEANFIRPLRQSLLCVTPIHVIGRQSNRESEPHTLTFASGGPVRLKGPATLFLSLRQNYRIVEAKGERGPWKVRTAGYFYNVFDSRDQHVVSYHWHPNEKIDYPHLHPPPTREGAIVTNRHHLPTGRISVEEVIRWLIVELNVEPLRDDWQAILSQAETAFRRWRTWE